jgi:hypothetical protein
MTKTSPALYEVTITMDPTAANGGTYLPTLEQLRESNHPDLHSDTAWIWGKNDEVSNYCRDDANVMH